MAKFPYTLDRNSIVFGTVFNVLFELGLFYGLGAADARESLLDLHLFMIIMSMMMDINVYIYIYIYWWIEYDIILFN